MSLDNPISAEPTLSERLTSGPLPSSDALRYALEMAEALRSLHDTGRVHGAFCPAAVTLGTRGASLAPDPVAASGVTPYTAPEVLQGRTPDARSDVFAFGAVFFEMLTGRQAFEAETPEALALVLTNSVPPALGHAAIDRLVGSCLEKDPAARWQRMQKVLMELRLLTVSARRADPDSSSRRERADAALHAELQQTESRIAARLDEQTALIAETRREADERGTLLVSLAETQAALSSEVAALEPRLAALGERIGAGEQAAATVDRRLQLIEQSMEAIVTGIGRAEQSFEATMARIAAAESGIQAVHERALRSEGALAAAHQAGEALEQRLSAEIAAVQQTALDQVAALESTRTAMSQTDDLVESVVEALEALQAMVIEPPEDRTVAFR